MSIWAPLALMCPLSSLSMVKIEGYTILQQQQKADAIFVTTTPLYYNTKTLNPPLI